MLGYSELLVHRIRHPYLNPRRSEILIANSLSNRENPIHFPIVTPVPNSFSCTVPPSSFAAAVIPAPKCIVTRLFLLMALLAASATLATGFFAMHYKVFLELLDLPKFRQEMERWGYEQSMMKDVLKARGKEYVIFLRCGAGAIAVTLAAGQGFRGVILLPIWISLVAAGFSIMMVQDYRAMVLYVSVLLEKCYLSDVMPLGLAQSGKDLTKRVARLPKDAPFEPSLADTLALQRLGVLLTLCFVVWVLLQSYRRKDKKE